MERSEFESLLSMAKFFQEASAVKQNYDRSVFWLGFQRGISRLFHGEKSGTVEEHEKWMTAADGEYPKELYDGYRTGFTYHDQKLEI
ncbi:unnamed protein product [marine sediment metagenome]|uniref:Uncharacterized protein n=1 Tax=marine sediment metagenome TaxID=412755 RepID=X1FEL2_9ZZZZ